MQPPYSVVTFTVLSHAPRIEEFAQVRRFCIWVFYEPLAYRLAVAPVPSLFVEMLANRGCDAADRCLASASAHDRARTDEARYYVLALDCRAFQFIRAKEGRTAQPLTMANDLTWVVSSSSTYSLFCFFSLAGVRTDQETGS